MKTRIPSFHLFFDRDFIVTVPMNASTMVVGRRSGCHLRINHGSISREHCEISLTESGEVVVRDLKSTNATRVNGKPVQRQTLAVGDVVDVGRCSLIFQEVSPSLLQAYGTVLWNYLRRSPSHTQLSSLRGPYQYVQNDMVIEFNVDAYEKRYTPDRMDYVRKIPRLKLLSQNDDNEVTQLSSPPEAWKGKKRYLASSKAVWIQSMLLLLLFGAIVAVWLVTILIRQS